MAAAPFPASLATEAFCYVTTTGRVSGRPHEIEIWFGASGRTIYMLAGGRERSDWVKNIISDSRVTVRIGGQEFSGNGRAVDPSSPEDALARKLLLDKYSPTYAGDLSEWGETALPVAVDV
jgi:deazaflavin-dependent oxidoreductase (nitroreductase family)